MASTNGYKASDLLQGQAHLYRVMYSFLNPMCIKWAIDLGIPDIIHNHGQAITLSELVSALQVPQAKATCIQRLMRLLAHNDIFIILKMDDNIEGKEAYALTPTSQLLVKGTDHCLSSMVQLLNDPTLVGLYHQLGKWTFGEELTIVETALGLGSYWDFINQNPTHLKIFNEAMESDSHLIRLALRDCRSVFEGLDSLVDVGGGTGNTGLTGSNNLSFVGGNIFKSIPHADAILLKLLLHNWSDDDCIKILKNCKEAISGKGKGGKLIIIDIVINEKQDEHEMTELKLLLDVVMMTSVNGKERDEKDWKRLLMKAGFEHYKIFCTSGAWSLIELYP
ncbi:Winged helix-like DNA-binding domain superfamily [Sesbania bispinosa]|nr:Winged helix-like DNA-binding domain superfamily [Sesbania bispinosa]